MPAQFIKLKELADARSGDKGSSANIGIIAHTDSAYHLLQEFLTADRVKGFLSKFPISHATRYELPNLKAFNFVLEGILEEGGSLSLRLDPQGKALGQMLLEMPIEVPMNRVSLDQNELATLSYPEEGVALMMLNRPEKRNALNVCLLQQMASHFDNLKTTSTRVLILAGEGTSFCTGMDLNEATDSNIATQSATLLANIFNHLVDASYVTIAAAQGTAAGGGAGLLSACDIVIAANDLTISYPETRRGLVPAQVTPLLMRQLPHHLAYELLLCGHPVDAERAAAVGLVNKVVSHDFLINEALLFAENIKKGAPQATAATKALLKKLEPKQFQEELLIAQPYHHASRLSAEAKEGTSAFLQKRFPHW